MPESMRITLTAWRQAGPDASGAFETYDVPLDALCAAYCRTIMNWPAMIEWRRAAEAEPEDLEELDVEF